MRPNLRKRLYQAGLVLGSLLMLYQCWGGYRAIQQSAVRIVEVHKLGIGLGLALAAVGLQVAAWLLLMRGLGVSLPIVSALVGYMQSALARYLPGGVWGYLSRSQWLFQDHHVPYAHTHLGSLLEVAGFVVSASAFALIYLVGVLPAWAPLALLAAAALGLAGIGLAWRRHWLQDPLAALARRLQLPSTRVRPVYWIIAAALYGLYWICQGAAVVAVARTFGVPIEATFLITTAVYATACLAGLLVVFVPAGLGVRETVLAGLLVGSAGGLPAASVISVSMRLITVAAELFWLFGWWVMSLWVHRGRQHHLTSEKHKHNVQP
jgi:uncharacterized membrane protein YbhN (UPF0104 family)